MEFNRETKNMIAIFALVLAITFGINYAVAPDTDQSFISWSVGLFVVAVLFWIWIRRDDMAANREEALKAAEDFAAKAKDKAEAELEKGKEKVEIIAEEVKETVEEVVEEVSEAVEEVVEEVTEATEEVVEEVAEEPEAVEETASDEPDDLTKVEGIGPTYAKLLADAGLTTFADIASKSQEELEQIIKDAGKRRPASIETWAEQAGLAAKGDWDGLQKLQDSLDGGRRK